MGLKRDFRDVLNLDTKRVEGKLPILAHNALPLRDDWMFDHSKGDIRLAKADLTGIDYKVYLVYKAWLGFKNEVPVNQKDIADELGIAKQSVNRSTKKLIDLRILIEGKKVGRHRTYRLNSFFGWKGHIDNRYYKAYDQDSQLLDDNIS